MFRVLGCLRGALAGFGVFRVEDLGVWGLSGLRRVLGWFKVQVVEGFGRIWVWGLRAPWEAGLRV